MRLTTPRVTYGSCDFMDDGVHAMMNKLSAYEDTGLEPEICKEYKTFEDEVVASGKSFNHILELLKAEEQGLLHKAPVPDGTPIFVFQYLDIFDETLTVCEDSYLHGCTEWAEGEINKNWFLTREAAEEALKGGATE